MQTLFDAFCPDWRNQSLCLRYAAGIAPERLWAAHLEAKQHLIEEVNDWSNSGMDHEAFTIGFARRATGYKRPTLLLRDVQQLKDIARRRGPLQLVYAGKAHPRDETGKAAIREIHRAAPDLLPEVKLAYLPNYRIETGLLLVAGVDLWLNTPLPPMEASGTSGMKAAHNGVPSFSVLDGWWREGHIEGVTGWSIGSPVNAGSHVDRDAADSDDLYRKLDDVILPLFYSNRAGWTRVMQQTIAHNAGFFNAQRMVQEYIERAYRRSLQLQEVT
jgi:starch phosphorylase